MENKMFDKMQSAWEAMKSLMDKQTEYLEKRGHESAELKEKIENVNARIDEIETKFARPSASSTEISTEMKEFRDFLAKGVVPSGLKAALTTQNEAAAGYLAPTEFVAEVISKIEPISPVRQVARVIPTRAQRLQVPIRTAHATAALTAEDVATSEDSTLAYGLVNVDTYDIRVWRAASTSLLAASGIDLEKDLAENFAESIARKEGYYFIAGDGSDEPEGVMSNVSISSVNSGSASAITADGIISAFYTLPEQAARNATWALKRATLGKIRTFKDASGNYLWQPYMSEGTPPSILGAPYIECPDMPAEGANTYPVIVGDFKNGYVIADHLDLQIIRDPYTLAEKGVVRFLASKSVGGAVVNSSAFIKVKCST